MAIPRPGKPYLWISHATRVVAGEAVCGYAPWFLAHHREYDKAVDESFDFASWSLDHTQLVTRRAEELRVEGWRVLLEDENKFHFKGETGTLGGKPDIVAIKPNVIKTVDAKTGRSRHADYVQVVLYMLLLPRCFDEYEGVTVTGEVTYRSDKREIGSHEVTPERVAGMFATLRTFTASTAPAKRPSASECRRCPIAKSECAERIETNETATGAADGAAQFAGF